VAACVDGLDRRGAADLGYVVTPTKADAILRKAGDPD
jgi:hypothetical protein